ncbi:hypothetical protein ACFO4E_11685 [Nocardiopsis mangrovi]|uniref:Trypsin-like peptidase domain-containing protein n=1 Tax=Nocardiopsis mangrovi TaxID=1179818 RepID=A0ABV9DX39_9ACTN
MHLESCRELKRTLFDSPTPLTAAVDIPWLGLGITLTPSGEYSLAVRVAEAGPAAAVLSRITAEARDEVDIVEVGHIRALSSPTPEDLQGRHRPLVPGVSVGHPAITAGTLGAFAVVDGAVHILSNNHVLGDSGAAQVGDAALQPGSADGGADPGDAVARLTAMAPLSDDQPNVVDAAIARLDDGIGDDPAAYPDGPIAGVTPWPPTETDVSKVGRTTAHTSGRITAFEVDGLQVDFGGRVLTFDDQVEISGSGGAFSDGGDSGSLIWTTEGRLAVGLLFAGSSSGGPDGTGLTFANPIQRVLDAFGAQLVESEA